MQERKQKEVPIDQWRSAFRGYIWLSAPLPFLFFCCGYLTPDLKTVLRLFTAGFFMLFLYVMFYRYDKIRHYVPPQKEITKRKGLKKWLTGIGLLILTILLVGLVTNLYIPLYLRGLIASGYYILLAICWYQKIKEPTKE